MAPGDSLSSAQRGLLSRATSATSEPTPGYVYKDIIDMVARDISILSDVEDYLLNKLARAEPYIKFKCLKLLKNLCARLPREFNRNKVCQCYAVMEARSYKAPHSEYNGDYLCHMVRNEVEELLKVVYGDPNPTTSAGAQFPGGRERMVGFGNSPAPQSLGSAGFGNTGYGNTGYGNTGFGNTPAPQGIGNVGGYGSANLSSQGSFGNSAAPGRMEGFGNFVPPKPGSNAAGSQAFKLFSDVANKFLPSSVVDKIERVGSAITTTAMEQLERHMSSGTDRRRQPPMPPAGYSNNFGAVDRHSPIRSARFQPQGAAAERTLLPSLIEEAHTQKSAADDLSGDSEMKLVKDVLTFSGIKVTPSQQILDDFLTRLKEVNARYVVEELVQNLNNRANKWQLQQRIMCVLEALLVRAKLPPELVSHMRTELEPLLVKCREESQLRVKADRLLHLIGGAEGADRKPTQTEGGAGALDLLDGAMSLSKAPTAVPEDLFGAAQPKAEPPRRHDPRQQTKNVPSDFTNHAFDLMDSFTPISSVPSPQPVEPGKPPQTAAEDDLFDFDKLTVAPAKKKAGAGEPDLFAVLDTVAFQPQARNAADLL